MVQIAGGWVRPAHGDRLETLIGYRRSAMRRFLARPPTGRVFTVARRIRNTDVTPSGRLRFDALARFLQQAAEDDLADAGWDEPYGWTLRKTSVAVREFPRFNSRIWLHTFCSATGPRWAERTTTVSGTDGDLLQATAVWAAVGRADGRPAQLGPEFHRLYGGAAQGRSVSVRLSHPRPPAVPAGGTWPLRASDFDTMGHVNNAIHWAAVEDVLAGLDWLPDGAELEYHRPVLPGCDPYLAASHEKNQVSLWLLDGDQRLASARLSRLADGRGSAQPSSNGQRDL
jgi:acyl-ACP thioesterase